MSKATCEPDGLMGEAWFMGETRKMYPQLKHALESTSTRYLQEVLEAIGSGISAFGLIEEWENWFQYLLPRLIPRCDEKFVYWLFEDLCTAFLQVDLATADSTHVTPDPQLVLQTLGCVIMSPDRWKDGRINVGRVLHPSNNNPAGIWGWANVSGDLAASLIVCLRKVSDEDLDAWVGSIFSIECPYWRAQLLTWYVGAQPLLSGKARFPSQFDDWTPKIGWSWSHVIGGTQGNIIVAKSLFPTGRVEAFRSAFEGNLANAKLKVWKDEILEIEALRSEVGNLVQNFQL
ncbi:hypothetical protein [Yoonia sp. R2-816]|uniref:hypothetical protein n=1 Tax=Yoonia sp. R2-816 TaxID=3342638 RepID=UPI003727A96E